MYQLFQQIQGLGFNSLGHRRRGEFPAICFIGEQMKELSVFIDESGDFGKPVYLPSNYLVTFIFHNQAQDISDCVAKLNESISQAGFSIDYIHMGPMIRREDIFKSFSLDERRNLAYKMLNFYNHCNIKHHTVAINRKEAGNKIELSGKIAKEIKAMFDCHMDFFLQFDKIIVYYDNGQTELSAILNAIFATYFSNVDFRTAEPQKYKLLQAADFVCTLELLNIKRENKQLSNSEKQFFYKSKELQKTFLKAISKKRL